MSRLKTIIAALALGSLASGESLEDMPKGSAYNSSRSKKRRNKPRINGLTKKQTKARARSKMAKRSRQINYRK